MPDGILRFEHGQIKLSGVLLPGIMNSLSVQTDVRFDSAEQDGMSGKVKVPLGWEDSAVVMTVELLSDDSSDCYDKLSGLNAIFKDTDKGANPKVYTVVNSHLIARGINQVVFSSLSSSETDKDDVILATLNFTEHLPVVTKTEKRTIATDHAVGSSDQTGGAPPASSNEPGTDAEVVNDPFAAGYTAGVS